MKKIVLLFLTSLFFFGLQAQDIENIQIDKPENNLSIEQIIVTIEQKQNIKFFFKKEWLAGVSVYNGEYPVDLKTFLEKTFSPFEITFFIRDNVVILYQKNYESINLEKDLLKSDEVKIIGDENAPLDEKVTFSGKIIDGQTNDILPGAVIRIVETNDGVVAGPDGNFSIPLFPGLYTFKINFVGFEETTSKVFLKSAGNSDFTLFENSLQLDAVTIEEFAIDQNVNSAQVSVTNLDMKTIKSIPALLGEADIVKSVLLLPGVSTVGEGSTGFNVRGGAADQNLLVYDKAPIFNPSHLFGFFSNINPDAIKDVTLFKGGIPARFGGRVSSVLEINSRNPSTESTELKGGVGLISSRLTADIPLIKGKSGLLIGGRASYIDWLLNRVKNVEVQRSSAQFYDVNGKWTTKIGKKDFLSVSGYLSNDEFKFAADTVYGWQTKNLNVSWAHTFTDDLSGEIALISANYGYRVDGEVTSSEFQLESDISNQIIAANIFYNPGSTHRLVFGGTYGTYNFNIGDLNPVGNESGVDPVNLEAEQAREFAIFVQDEYKINQNLTISGGLRYSSFDNVGAKEVFDYNAGETRSESSITGSTIYEDGELIQRYSGFEPRFSLKYNTSVTSSIKIGYNRTQQFIHTISNTAAITPIDIWKPSDKYLAPKIADQISFGYFRNFKDNIIEASAEVYYKNLKNEIDYKNGASILLNGNLEQDIISGKGRSYGLELYVKKSEGRLTGWISYTLSRTEKQIIGQFEEETINFGNFYAAEYDKPHNFSLVGDYRVSNRWKINGNFTYSSGRPFTGPDVKFRFNGNVLTYFANRNQQRIPNYHRLDLSITLEPGLKKDKLLNGSWTLSFYNVYGRENAYSVFIGERRTSAPIAYKFSVLGSVFPSLSYNFEL